MLLRAVCRRFFYCCAAMLYWVMAAPLAQASGDAGCEIPMTAHLEVGQNVYCVFGLGNAVLNPGNDSSVNTLLLMLHPSEDQHLNLDNLWFMDATSESVLSPFQTGALQSGDPEAVKQTQQKRYQTFTDLLARIEPDIKQQENLLQQLNGFEQPPALGEKAERLLSFQIQIAQDPELGEADQLQLLRRWLNLYSHGFDSDQAKQYDAYLDAARAFHAGDYAAADTAFVALQASNVGWVRETALYNRIRIAIRQTQEAGADQYGFFELKKVDPTLAGGVLTAIDAYLSNYPEGRYATSARHLKRRGYWLTGNKEAMLAEFDAAVKEVRSSNALGVAVLLADEIDNKYLFADHATYQPDPSTGVDSTTANIRWHNPVLAGTQMLLRLRRPQQQEGAVYNPVPLEELKAHEGDFTAAQAQSLYQFLQLADLFYHQEKWEEVVTASADWEQGLVQGDYAAFSRVDLRLQALQKLKRFEEALVLVGHLRRLSPSPLLRDHFELAQAQLLESSGQLAKVFAADSTIQSQTLRRRLLRSSADATLLRQVVEQSGNSAEEKAVALATLLKKSLFSRQYGPLLDYQKKYGTLALPDIDGLAFLRDETIAAEEGFHCPNWSAVLADLAQAKPAPRSGLCLGERLRTLEDNIFQLFIAFRNELGTAPDGFGKLELTRLSLYLPLINNPAVQGEDEAFALRRAIYCFATAGYNHCGGEDISPEQRKAWFNRLKSTYKQSTWAQQQKYYW